MNKNMIHEVNTYGMVGGVLLGKDATHLFQSCSCFHPLTVMASSNCSVKRISTAMLCPQDI
jgi:hypothetical protein